MKKLLIIVYCFSWYALNHCARERRFVNTLWIIKSGTLKDIICHELQASEHAKLDNIEVSEGQYCYSKFSCVEAFNCRFLSEVRITNEHFSDSTVNVSSKFTASFIKSLHVKTPEYDAQPAVDDSITKSNDEQYYNTITLHNRCTLQEAIKFETPGGLVICTGLPSQIRPEQVINGMLVRPPWHKQTGEFKGLKRPLELKHKFSGIATAYFHALMFGATK